MKTWYKAVCDKCGEAIDIFVNNPSYTVDMLGKYDAEIQTWLNNHYGCELRLLWRDDQLDDLIDDNYKYVTGSMPSLWRKDFQGKN